jgi:hypothetical protein
MNKLKEYLMYWYAATQILLVSGQGLAVVAVFFLGYNRLTHLNLEQVPWYWATLVVVAATVWIPVATMMSLFSEPRIPLRYCFVSAAVWLLPIVLTQWGLRLIAQGNELGTLVYHYRFYPTYVLGGTLVALAAFAVLQAIRRADHMVERSPRLA